MAKPLRAGFVYSDDLDCTVHVPDLMVPDHKTPLKIGFLWDRFEVAATVKGRKAAPAKGSRKPAAKVRRKRAT